MIGIGPKYSRLGPTLLFSVCACQLGACSDDSESSEPSSAGIAGNTSRDRASSASRAGQAGTSNTRVTAVNSGGANQAGSAPTAEGTSAAAGTTMASTAAVAPAAGSVSAQSGIGGETAGTGGAATTAALGGATTSGGTSSASGTLPDGTSQAGAAGSTSVACDAQPHVLSTATKPWALALDATHVYFTTRVRDGKVLRAPIDGGSTATISTNEVFPHELAVSGGRVFWVALGTGTGHVYQASVTGSNRIELAAGATTGVFGLNADENNVYYFTNLNVVYSVKVGGGTPVNLSGGPYNSSIVDMMLQGSNLYWANQGVTQFTRVQPETAAIARVDVSGSSAASKLVTLLDFPQFEIAVDSENVFWNDEQHIYRTSHVGGTSESIATLAPEPSSVSPIADMASDGVHLFYADHCNVYRLPVSGGSPELVTAGWQGIGRLALDETSVYFTDNEGGAVVRIAKCAMASGSGAGTGGSSGIGGAPNVGTATAGGMGTVAGAGGTLGAAGNVSVAGSSGCTTPDDCHPASIVATASNPYGLALDAEYVYYTSYGANGSVMRAPIAGGDSEPVAIGENGPHDLAVDGDRVYWCLADTAAGHLITAQKTGGDRRQLATGMGNGLGRVLSDGLFAYYVTAYSSIYRVAIAGGIPTIVSSGPYGSNVQDLAFFNDELFWTNDGEWNSDYSAKLTDSAYVAKAHVTGSPSLGRFELANPLNYPLYRVAADASGVFFIDDEFVYRASRAGGEAQKLAPLAPASGAIVDLHSDGNALYFADYHGVYRLPTSGASVEALSTGWGSLVSLAVNDTSVYFTDYARGWVLKIPK